MANPILLKHNATAGAVPTAVALAVRELALNIADGRLFTKTSAGTVVEFARAADRGSWTTSRAMENVTGQLAWKNYGNGHTVIDASGSTAPNGAAISNTNAQNAWAASFPTLMGWNGVNTYGVRVDSARTADTLAGNAPSAFAVAAHNHSGTYVERAEVKSFGTLQISPVAGGGASCTTAQFIATIQALGMFNYAYSFLRCTWDYAGNNDISDTGFGAVELAGCLVETWGGTDNKIIRITRPTTGAGGAQELIYNDQGPGYSPGWRQVWNSGTLTNLNQLTNGPGYTANAGTVTGVTATAPVASSGGTAPVISMAAATASANGYMTSAYAGKLDGIAAGATAYAHPANHPASVITQDASNRFVTDAEKTAWNAKQPAGTYATGTGTASGTNTGDQTTITGDAGRARGLTRSDSGVDTYNVQSHWDGSLWELKGYNTTTYHAGVKVAYSTTAGSVAHYSSDAGVILQSYNTSASSAAQLTIKHNLGAVDIFNARGTINFTGNLAGNATTAGGLAVNTTLKNNVANQIVRTDANGYANFGWINTDSGTATGTLTRVYCSQDAYLRYLSPADFMTSIGAAPKASPTFTGTVTAPTFSGALTGNASGSAGRLESADTRAVADTPQSFARGLEVDFKTNTTDGLGDGGTYHAVMTVRGYADWSGGGVRQVGFTDNHNLWVRGANADTTWGAWRKLAYADTIATASALGGVKVGPGLTIDGAGILATAGGSEAPMLITANTAAVAGSSYVLTAALTLTLPANPPVGSVILFQNASGAACTIARNGQPIMTLAEDLTLDLSYTSGKLVYTNATQGWLITDMSATQVTATANADYATTSGTATNLTGFTNSKSSNPVAGADSLTNNGIGYVNAVSLLGQVDGALYAQAYSTSYVHQVFGDYRTGQMAVRGKNNGTWQAWRTVLDSTNYTSYAPTKTGTGASGSWAISVTGSAASITGTYGGTLTSSQVTSALGYTPSNPGGLTVVIASSSITATAGTTYVLTASLTLTLPASPSAGAMVGVSNHSGVATCTVARNAQNIMGLGQDLTLDTSASFQLVFADATRGWVLL